MYLISRFVQIPGSEELNFISFGHVSFAEISPLASSSVQSLLRLDH